VPTPRPKKCRSCQAKFRPSNSLQIVCSPKCALDHAKNKLEASRQAAYQPTRSKKVRDKGWYTKRAQMAFNAFIRERDKSLPCVSCGRHHKGQYHAGHFRPVGSQPALRFDETNCHKQCSVCNNYRSGNLTQYEPELIRRVGAERVEFLKLDHPPRQFTNDELDQIAKTYRAKTRDLQKNL